MAQAGVEQQKANLERAQINLERTGVRAPVSGWLTNPLIREDDGPGGATLKRTWIPVRIGARSVRELSRNARGQLFGAGALATTSSTNLLPTILLVFGGSFVVA